MERDIVLVTGMSGAGKSSAMNALEDLGYYCIDNFPKELLSELEDIFETRDPKYKKVALSVSANDYLSFVNFFDNLLRPMQVVFLDCDDDELLLRYRFTRRMHPMISSGKASTLEEAIEIERDYFDHLQTDALNTFHFDTTKLTPQTLSNVIRQRFKTSQEQDFKITFESFGFKHGVPMDADTIIDVRFLPNPFYEPALRSKTGNDPEVYDYVMLKEETQRFTRKLDDMFDFIFDQYQSQNKNHMIVAVGCTGGQHRSVSIANYLYERYKKKFPCFKIHRDIAQQVSV